MLNYFDWNLCIPTAIDFCDFFMEYIVDATEFECNWMQKFDTMDDMKSTLIVRALEFVDLTVFGEYGRILRSQRFSNPQFPSHTDCRLLYNVLPSQLAASCLAAARYTETIEPIWSQALETITQYEFADIVECMMDLITIQFKVKNNRLNCGRFQ